MRFLRILCLSTFVIATIFLASSAKATESSADGLRVATFKSDVTPPLGNYLYDGVIETIEHPLLAKGVVLDDGGRRYVLCTVDWCVMRNSTYDIFREKLADALETDVSNVAVQCVHQHTAPFYDASGEKLLMEQEDAPRCRDLKFLDAATDRLAAAAKASLKNLEKVDRIGTGQAKVDRVASTRRLIKDGKFYVRFSSTKNPRLQALPEGFIDPILKTITLAQGERPIVRLHYYATHPQSFYHDGRTSWDVAGIARERLEKEDGAFQIYFTGCAGDVAMGKYNDGTRRARGELAERLYQGMAAATADTKLVPLGPLCWRTVDVLFPPRSDGNYDPVKNKAILADATAKDQARFDAASNLACRERLAKPIELCSLQIGDVYIVNLPGEPMLAFQKYAQAARPDAFVAVAGYGQAATGYICTAAAFTEGGYEPTASVVRPESEEILKTAIRKLLHVD